MPRKSNTRAAQGSGTIRQRPDGKWEARFIAGHDPGDPQIRLRKDAEGSSPEAGAGGRRRGQQGIP